MLKVNDTNFYYEIQGSGQPIILIAGYTCDYSMWKEIADHLSQRFQVLSFDNRAVGRTTDTLTALSVELMAQDVMAIAEQLNLKTPHIVGHSMGGAIAQVIAAQYPNKIGKLCLLNTAAKLRLATLGGLKSLLALRENNFEFNFIFETALPWMFGEVFLNNEEAIAAFKKAVLENPYPQSLTDQIRQFNVLEKFDGVGRLQDIIAPTLVVCGMQDIIVLPMEAEYLVSGIVNAELVSVDCGHSIMYEAPGRLTEIVINFLSA